MSDFMFVALTVLFIVIAAVMILKKMDSKLVFFFVGTLALLVVTAITGVSVLGEKTTGNIFLDVVDVIRTKFISTVQGTGIRLMVVAGYVMLMNHMKASNVLAAAAGKVLIKLKNPYLILAGVFIVGSILKVFITSQISLGLLFMATIFPILISLGVSKVSAAAVLITIGMLDMGPNDSSAIFGATEVMGITPMDYFMNYEILVGGAVILIMAVFYAVYFKYMDKKEYGETKTGSGGIVEFSPKDFGIPVFYGVFPLIPLALVVIFSFADTINMDIITANLIGFFFVFICDLIVTKSVAHIGENLKKVFEWMGQYFTNIVIIIVAAGVFAETITQLKGITILTGWISNLTGAALIAVVMLSLIVFGTALLTGSGNAPWFAFGPLTPGIGEALGTQTAAFAVPMHLAGGIGRCISPFCGGVIAISGVAEVEITDVIKRNMVPMIVAYALNVAASYIIFVIL